MWDIHRFLRRGMKKDTKLTKVPQSHEILLNQGVCSLLTDFLSLIWGCALFLFIHQYWKPVAYFQHEVIYSLPYLPYS